MSDKPGFEHEASELPADHHQDPYMEHTSHGFDDHYNQYGSQPQSDEQQYLQQQQQQQQQQYHRDLEDDSRSHDEFTGSGGLVHGRGDYYDEEDLPANFARGSQGVPQTEDQPRSLEEIPGNTGDPLAHNPGEFPYQDENEAQMGQEDQQVVPGSNVNFDDERPIMGSYYKDDSPQQQEVPQDFGDFPAQQHEQQQQLNSDDEEDDTIDEVHPAEAAHGYDRLEEEQPQMNDHEIAGDIDSEEADIEMDPVDNMQFEERQDLNEMDIPEVSRLPHDDEPSTAAVSSSQGFDDVEDGLVSGGFNPTTLEEPIQPVSAAPGVESSRETMPEDDIGPNDVEERMMSQIAGGLESGVPTQMMLDDQEDDEDKENAAPQLREEDLIQPQRMEQAEAQPGLIPGQEDVPRDFEESGGMKYEDEEEEDEVSEPLRSPGIHSADIAGLDNPAFAEDEMRKLDQISEFEDVEKEKTDELQEKQVMSECEKQEDTVVGQRENDSDNFADNSEFDPMSDQFSTKAVTSEVESTPNTPGFVDNLSELASPNEVIPQPLPSPPEPRDGISPFDPLEDRDSPYEKYRENESDAYTNEFTREEPGTGGAAEREESGFNNERDDAGALPATSAGHDAAGFPGVADEMSGFGGGDSGVGSTSLLQDNTTAGGAADFLTGEVEGETTFGVDGTAATTLTETTAPITEISSTGGQENAGFLNSEDEEDEEEDEEEEDVSQLMDHGVGEAGDATGTTTTTTTTTEEASDDLTGTGMEQEAATDNALMSMSMEGSFYDDGGDVIGGSDEQGRQHAGGMNHLSNSMYHPDPITEESASCPSSYDQRADGFLSSQTDDQNISHDLMQTSTDIADNILGEQEMEQQQQQPGQQSGVDLLTSAPVTTAQEHSSSDAAAFDGLGDVPQQGGNTAAEDDEASLRQMEEQLRLEEEQLRQEEELQRQEEERQRQEEEERQRQAEEERQRLEEEEQRRLEEEQRQEEERQRLEQERLRQEEDERLRQEEEKLRQEEERLRLEEEEEERLRQEEEKLRQAEEEERRLEAQRLQLEEEQRRQQAEEEERRLEAERQQLQQQEEEEKRRLEEEAELQRLEDEQRRLEEEEKARQEELAKASASEDIPVTEAPADAPAQPDNSSSVDAPPKVEEEQPAAAAAPDTTPEAAPAAAVAAAAPAVAAAAAASPEKKSTAKTTAAAAKKSTTATSKTASAKTTTSATKTATKTPTKTTTNGRPASATTKKAETTKTTPSSAATANRKPFDNRPITALERKAAAAKPTPSTSATRPTSASKSNAPLPSYAQPITPRKPREAKVLSPEEKKKATAAGRTPSATARTPRPQSASTTSTTRTTSATTTTRTSSATTKSGTSSGATSPTKPPTTARPKSSPTKLSNGESTRQNTSIGLSMLLLVDL